MPVSPEPVSHTVFLLGCNLNAESRRSNLEVTASGQGKRVEPRCDRNQEIT